MSSKATSLVIEFPEDRSGLQLTRGDESGIDVWFVSPGTPAAKAGFKEGDRLLKINDIAIEHFGGIESIRNVLCGAVGNQLRIAVKRGGSEMGLSLTLKELL